MTQVTEPFPIFYDDDGTPLEAGMIYVGAVNQNPRAVPIQVYYDEALTVPASQPIRTLGGRPAYQGAPTRLYVAEPAYSIEVLDRKGRPVTGPTTGGIGTRGTPSVKDYGAVGNGVANDTAAIDAAIAASNTLIWPAGIYMVDTLATPAAGSVWIAEGEVTIRRRSASAFNVLLLASNRIDCTGITFDGNKAANSVACNAVIVTASESRFDRCKFINSKTVSGGFGAGLSYDETAVTADSDHVLWDCYAYDNDAQGFAGQNIRGLEAIGNTAHSNGKSGFEFNNYDVTLTKKLYDCRMIGNYAYENGENGIYVGNFIESNSLVTLDYGPNNLDSYRFVVEGNVCRNNGFYGIAAQGESISVADNICAANAQTDATTGGILMNAVKSACTGNLASNNLGFGLDAGGSMQSIVSSNVIYSNVGTGLNIGATVDAKVSGNLVWGNGGASGVQVDIHNVDTDAAFRAFPFLTTSLSFTGNRIVCTASAQRGVFLHDGVVGVHVCDNDFYGSNLANMIVNVGKQTVIRNNRVPSALSRELAVTSGAVAIPDVLEFAYTNSTATVTSLDYATVQSVVGRGGIGWVEVTAGGTGYTSAPTVVFTGGGGSGAAATAHIRNGVVIGCRMTNYGTGYTSAPTMSFTGGGGSGATATAQVGVPLADFREFELMTLQACTINRGGTPVVESKSAANLSMTAADGVKLRALFGQWYVGPRYG